MTFRKSILLATGLSMIAALLACSSGTTTPVITVPPAALVVILSSFPSSVTISSQRPITATVNNDSANGGVTWSCAPAGSCGTFSAPTSASGTPVTYFAPTVIPTSTVVITATSVTNTAISASTAPIAIIPAALADGNYVFSLAGTNVIDGSSYHVAGAFTVALGLITGGEQDFVDDVNELSDAINATGSSTSINSDGNLQIVLATADTTGVVGVAGVETLDGTLLPASTTGRTFLVEFDPSATASGELDMQNATAAAATPSLGYAFVLNGLDQFAEGSAPEAIGGIINVDNLAGTGTISGTGSIFDANDDMALFPGETLANTSIVSAPDPFGRVTFTLDATDTVDFPEIILAGYIVDAIHIRLVETSDTYAGALGGVALSQGANTGLFTLASASNTYVVGLSGADANGMFQAVSQITPNSTTTAVTGFVDFNDLVNSTGSELISPDPVTAAAYSVDAAGAGDFTITDLTDGTNAYNVQLYLDGNGNALAIALDSTDVLGGAGSMQSGAGTFSAGSFNLAYGLNATGWGGSATPSGNNELDVAGPVTADGVGTFGGYVDFNWLNSPGPTYPDVGVFGQFSTADAASVNGIFTGTIAGLDVTINTNTDAFNYYLIDAIGDNIAIETDLNQLTLGVFAQQ
jgi:hypothetical protein